MRPRVEVNGQEVPSHVVDAREGPQLPSPVEQVLVAYERLAKTKSVVDRAASVAVFASVAYIGWATYKELTR